MDTTRTELKVSSNWTRNSMNNLSSNCELIDARIYTSDKDLPVQDAHVICAILLCCCPYLKPTRLKTAPLFDNRNPDQIQPVNHWSKVSQLLTQKLLPIDAKHLKQKYILGIDQNF